MTRDGRMRWIAPAMLLLVVAACTRTGWVSVRDDEGGFRASFPAEPTPTVDEEGHPALVARQLGWEYSIDWDEPLEIARLDRAGFEDLRGRRLARLPGWRLETTWLDKNGDGVGYVARGPNHAVCEGHIFRRDVRLFRVEVSGFRRVVESPDTKRFFGGLLIDERPDPTPTPLRVVRHLDPAAARETAESYVALLRMGRQDEAWRYLPAATRASVPVAAHAAFWQTTLPAGALGEATVVSVAVHGTSARVVVAAHGATVELVENGVDAHAEIAPARLLR